MNAIGETPMLSLHFQPENVTLWAKAEFLNPSGSIKDRLARFVICDAERRGLIGPGSKILECSSGNSGVAFTMLGAIRGYPTTIVISEVASLERRNLIRQLGGEVITFPGNDYWKGVELTRQLAVEDSRYFLPRQFENPLNAEDHEFETAQEILRQISGPIDAFVAGYGTGGTLAGVSRGLRRVHPKVQIVAMEPAEAALLSGEVSCAHSIEGIADGFVPPLLEGVQIDRVSKVSSADAMKMTKRLTRQFGLLVGTSSGANIVAALAVAQELGPAAQVITLLCDRAERYFSTHLFHHEPFSGAPASEVVNEATEPTDSKGAQRITISPVCAE